MKNKVALLLLAFSFLLIFATPALASTINVPGDYATIQAAVDAASAGDTINVSAGSYTEAVSINKSLNLVGAGVGSSIIKAPATLPAATSIDSAVVTVVGSGVSAEISGFSIAGPGPTACGSIKAGIFVRGSAFANIHNNSVEDIRDDAAPVSGCQNGVGILVGRNADATIGTATIADNQIVTYQKGGVVVDGAGSNATLTNNVVTGIGTTTITAQNGIQISRGASATLTDNMVTANSFHIDGNPWDWAGTGILLYESGAVDLAGGNDISGNDQGLYISGPLTGPVTVGAEIFGASTAPLDRGYYVINYDAGAVDLTQSTFEGLELQTAAPAEILPVKARIWDGIDESGLGVATLKSGNQFVTPSGSIQRAIDAASNGDTINVAAGTYDTSTTILVNKEVTISGAGGGGTIVQGTDASAVSVFEITASNVTLQNLEITHNALPPFVSGGWAELPNSLIRVPVSLGLSGINIQNNMISVPAQSGAMSTWNGVAITVGASTTTGISITGNTIHNTRDGVVIQYGNTGTISDNNIYDTKGGVMNYTSSQADADNRAVSGNSWGTSHNEWDIVWNTAYFVPDYQQSVLALSGANNDAYVLDRRAADAGACASLTGNRSHIFVDDDGTTTAAHPAKGNFNERFTTVALGIDAVVPGGKVLVANGTYTGNDTINKSLSLAGEGAASTTIAGEITVSANDIAIDGFTITNPSGKHGIYAQDRSNLTITNNIITDIGSADISTTGTNFGIAVVSSAAAIDEISITGNQINHIVGGVGKSADGISIGWSTGIYDVTGLTIQGNEISDITSSTDPWIGGGHGGMGAYGIIINHGTGTTGKTVAPQVLDNNISNLEALWAHGIGLEGNTPNAVVQGNSIDNLVDHKSPADPDAAAISVEDNASADTIAINNNSFTNVWLGVRNATTLIVDASANWWGAVDGPGAVGPGSGSMVSTNVIYSPWLSSSDLGSPAVSYNSPTGEIHIGNPEITATAVSGSATLNAEVSLASVDIDDPWNYTMYTFACTVSSGNVSCPATGLPEGDYTATVTVWDAVGRIGTAVGTFRIVDDAAPVTTDNADSDWHTSDVTVTLSCTDTVSGCASTSWSADNGGGSGTFTGPGDGSIVINNEGITTLTYHSVDNLGHVETEKTATVKIDKTAPVTTDNADSDWHTSDVTVTLSCTDTVSGCASTTWSGDNGLGGGSGTSILVSSEGTTTITYHSVDVATNVETEKTATVKLDKTAPIVAYVDPTGTVYTYVDSITGTVSDPDPSSGSLSSSLSLSLDGGTPSTSACTITSGNISCAVSGLTNGVYSAVISVSDEAGNISTASGSFTYAAQGKPDLVLSVYRTYWNSYADYLSRTLSVDYRLTNNSTGLSAIGVQIVGSIVTNGATLMNVPPISVGDIPAAEYGSATLKYLIPSGITTFKTKLYAISSDPCGTSYDYPEPYPGA